MMACFNTRLCAANCGGDAFSSLIFCFRVSNPVSDTRRETSLAIPLHLRTRGKCSILPGRDGVRMTVW